MAKINISLERRKENSSGWFVTEIILKILALVSEGLGHHVDVVERDVLGGEREQRGR